MDKESFKIGDKVKLKEPKDWGCIGGIGTVMYFDNYIRVTWEKGEWAGENFPHFAREIEHTVRIGEQLLFKFMEGSY